MQTKNEHTIYLNENFIDKSVLKKELNQPTISSKNIETFRKLIDSSIKLEKPELQGYVLRIENLRIFKQTGRGSNLTLRCNYTKSIKQFIR